MAERLGAVVARLGPPTVGGAGTLNNPCMLARYFLTFTLGLALPMEGMLLLEAYWRRRFLLGKLRERPPLAPADGRRAAVAVASVALQAWVAWQTAEIVDSWWLAPQ